MNEIKNSKILVTGGAGFIGSNLVESLIDGSNNEIVVVDDLSMGKIENLPNSPHLHFFKQSITDKKFMNQLLISWQFDYIFLLAAVASVADTIARPLETHYVNQDANLNILETIRVNKLHVRKVLFASSAAVYGNNPDLPKKECSPIDPLSPYAIDKFSTERFVIDYGRLYGIPTVCTRFFNVYGPKQNPKSPYSGVLSLISNAIIKQNKFTIFGDGKQIRDFVYVEDVIHALRILITNDNAMHDVFNVATGIGEDLNTVIRIFESISGKQLDVKYDKPRQGDIKESRADISKLVKLNYSPKNSLKIGLTKYWNNLKDDLR